MHGDRTSRFSLPKFEPEYCCHASTEEYLADLCDRFVIDGNVHLVEAAELEEYESSRNRVVSLVVAEAISEHMFVPKNLISVDRKDVFDVMEQVCEHSAILEFVQSLVSQIRDESRAKKHLPWYGLGYFRKILPSLTTVLGENGYVRTGTPQQVRFSVRSVVYRIPTAKGNVYFKAVPEGSNEIVQTRAILQLFPDVTSTLVAMSADLNGIFMLDVGLTTSNLCFAPPSGKPAVGYQDQAKFAGLILQQWASIQQPSLSHVEELISAGLPVYDAPWIRHGFEDVWVLLKSISFFLPSWRKVCVPANLTSNALLTCGIYRQYGTLSSMEI